MSLHESGILFSATEQDNLTNRSLETAASLYCCAGILIKRCLLYSTLFKSPYWATEFPMVRKIIDNKTAKRFISSSACYEGVRAICEWERTGDALRTQWGRNAEGGRNARCKGVF